MASQPAECLACLAGEDPSDRFPSFQPPPFILGHNHFCASHGQHNAKYEDSYQLRSTNDVVSAGLLLPDLI